MTGDEIDNKDSVNQACEEDDDDDPENRYLVKKKKKVFKITTDFLLRKVLVLCWRYKC